MTECLKEHYFPGLVIIVAFVSGKECPHSSKTWLLTVRLDLYLCSDLITYRIEADLMRYLFMIDYKVHSFTGMILLG